MKVKVTKKTAANNIELRDTVYKITLYSKNKEDLKDATELVRENIHYKLRDIKNDDYIESRTVLSDSLQYPETFSDKPDNSEVIEVVRGFNAKTTEATIHGVVTLAVIQSRIYYPEVAIDLEIYKAGSEMPGAKSAEVKEEATASANDPMISFINPSNVLTNTAQDAAKDIIELVCVSRYGALNGKLVCVSRCDDLNDKKLSEFHKRITGVIADAYAKGLNAVTIPHGFVKVVPNLEGTKYSEKKISTLAYYIMALIFASGGDYDTDVEASFVKPDMFPPYGLAAMPNSLTGMDK